MSKYKIVVCDHIHQDGINILKNNFIVDPSKKFNLNIDVLVGNIPATAYETFKEIAKALPNVRFIPSIETQFSNKSKENVTLFCEKYNVAAPKTLITYDDKKADDQCGTSDVGHGGIG